MSHTRKHTYLWLAAALLFSLLTFIVIGRGLSGKIIVKDSDGIPEAAEIVLESLSAGDWTTLSQKVSGEPVLMPLTGSEGSAEEMIYQAYQNSLRWSCREGFTLQDSCVIQHITVTCLDIPGTAKAMAAILAETTADSADPEEREAILYAAAEQVLANDPPVAQYELALTFLREEKQWRVVPNNSFQALLSGFTTH